MRTVHVGHLGVAFGARDDRIEELPADERQPARFERARTQLGRRAVEESIPPVAHLLAVDVRAQPVLGGDLQLASPLRGRQGHERLGRPLALEIPVELRHFAGRRPEHEPEVLVQHGVLVDLSRPTELREQVVVEIVVDRLLALGLAERTHRIRGEGPIGLDPGARRHVGDAEARLAAELARIRPHPHLVAELLVPCLHLPDIPCQRLVV